ncbi:MAG: blue (type 1) copper domain protein [Solirubrobacterales bacterium]|nr:blue (type 1) copper domain protein [Solirubrobacterales bacterium]
MPTTSPLTRTAVAVGIAALLAPAGLIAVADAASTKTIKLQGKQFSPRSVTIKKGDKVKFRWAGGTHNLIGPKANLGARSSGAKTITFTAKGTYRYTCTLHDNMTTKVSVR